MLGRCIASWGLVSLLLPSLQFMINKHLTSDLGITNTGALGRDPQPGIPFSIRTPCASCSAYVIAATTGVTFVLGNCTSGIATHPAGPNPLAAKSKETVWGGRGAL